MHIKEIKPSQRKKGRFLVTLEDGDILRITEEELLRFGLRPGEELGEEDLAALRQSAATSQVKARAAGMIGRQALSSPNQAPPRWPGITAAGAMALPGSGRSSSAGGSPGSCGRPPWRSCPTAARCLTP